MPDVSEMVAVPLPQVVSIVPELVKPAAAVTVAPGAWQNPLGAYSSIVCLRPMFPDRVVVP